MNLVFLYHYFGNYDPKLPTISKPISVFITRVIFCLFKKLYFAFFIRSLYRMEHIDIYERNGVIKQHDMSSIFLDTKLVIL